MPSTIGYPKRLTRRVSKSILEEVNAARQKLEHGKTYRRNKRESEWKQAEKQYEGNHWTGETTDEHIVVNMSFSTVNTIIPYVTGNNPQFRVKPFSGDATPRNAAIQQAFLNRLWRSDEVEGQEELETAAHDGLMYGDGYLKVGYSIEEIRTSQGGYDEIGQLWVSRTSPWDIFIDPTADGIHNARWVAQRLRLTRAELEANDNFHNTHEENVNFGTKLDFDEEAEDRERFMREVFDGSEYATLYEFYDTVNNVKIVFGDGELPLQYVEDIGAVPIIQLANYRIPRCPYHMGEMEQIWSLQQELNRSRSHMIQHRKRNVQKFAYRENALGQDAINALRSSKVNEGIPVKGDQDLDQIVKPLAVQPLSADVYNVSEIISNDIYEISGVNEYLRGSVPEIRRTATEATIIEGASNVKSQHKLRQVEKAARRVGTMLLAFAAEVYPQTAYEELQLYLTGREAETVARADDPSQVGNDVIVRPGPDIWRGTYEVEVERASTELRNPTMRAEKWRAMFHDLVESAPTLRELGVTPNIRKVMEMWFEAAGVQDPDAMFIEGGQAGPPVPLGEEPPATGEGTGLPPNEIPPDASMGAFSEENTGTLEAV